MKSLHDSIRGGDAGLQRTRTTSSRITNPMNRVILRRCRIGETTCSFLHEEHTFTQQKSELSTYFRSLMFVKLRSYYCL